MRQAALVVLLFLLVVCAVAPVVAQPNQPALGAYLPLVVTTPERVVIAAAHIDSARSGEADEAVLLWNTGDRSVALAGWQLGSGSRRTIEHGRSPITRTSYALFCIMLHLSH